jgi:hypothetical protein
VSDRATPSYVTAATVSFADLEILRCLGGGCFGEVYLARWHGDTLAAVKATGVPRTGIVGRR